MKNEDLIVHQETSADGRYVVAAKDRGTAFWGPLQDRAGLRWQNPALRAITAYIPRVLCGEMCRYGS